MWIDAAGQGKSAGAVQTRIFIAETGASAARKTFSSLGRFTGGKIQRESFFNPA